MEKYFLTTPIYYVNARPHIGHAYTTIVADVLARRSRAQGIDTFFLTGTDEHGQKIERSAQAAGIPPQQFTDQVSKSFEDLWNRMGLTFDKFIRTTSPEHKRGVQKLFATLYERGFIYLAKYTGSYCVSDEAFVDLPAGTPCPDCGRPLETVTEENFFFKLSEFQLPLLNLIESNTLLIEPDSARNEVLSFLRGPVTETLPVTNSGTPYIPGSLKDLSISRSSFTWGVPVPEPAASTASQKHVIYVWLDALANYMTALGYGSDDETKWRHYWPADLHLVGKEITRFHCIYWPAFLLAAGLPTPKRITANGWLLFDNSKMSKSKGNVVRTETILDAFGGELYAKQFPDSTRNDQDLFASDVLRYYLLREIPFGQDGSFSFEALITRYNADLANGYGNLVSRTLSMISKFRDAQIPTSSNQISFNVANGKSLHYLGETNPYMSHNLLAHDHPSMVLLRESTRTTDSALQEEFEALRLSRGVIKIFEMVTAIDIEISDRKPWALAKSEDPVSQDALSGLLYSAAEAIRVITALLYPILPCATASVWRQLGLGDIEAAAANGELKDLKWGGLQPGTKLGPLAPIFPRADKGLAQIMTDMESPKPAQPEPIECVTGPNDPPSANLGSITPQHDAKTPAKDDLPVTSLASESTKRSTSGPVPETWVSTDAAAGPRTAALTPEPNPGSQVAGSAAETIVRPSVPSHHEAPASGIFSGAQSTQPSDASPQITIDDFAKVELRVAQVLVCERIPKADKLLRLEVDLGYEKRQILSGIAEWYTPQELIGRRIVVITNLAPRKMRGLESHGMLLAASAPAAEGEAGGRPHLATFGADAESLPLGSRLK